MRLRRVVVVFLWSSIGGPLVAVALVISLLESLAIVHQLFHGGSLLRFLSQSAIVALVVVQGAFVFGGMQAVLSGVIVAVLTYLTGSFGYATAAGVGAIVALPVNCFLLAVVWRLTLKSSLVPVGSDRFCSPSSVWLWMVFGAVCALIVRWLLGVCRVLPVPVPASATPVSCKAGKS